MTERSEGIVSGDGFGAFIMSGMGRNEASRDAGRVVHAVRKEGMNPWTRAVCSAMPGRSGNGWITTTNPITCERCLKSIAG